MFLQLSRRNPVQMQENRITASKMQENRITASRIHRKNKNDSGVAMIFSLIVGVVIMVFCLLMLLVAYTLYSQTTRKLSQTQCKVLAQSMAEQIKDELANEAGATDEPDGLRKMLKDEMSKDATHLKWVPSGTKDADLKAGQFKDYEFYVEGVSDLPGYCFKVTFQYQTVYASDEAETELGSGTEDDDLEEADTGSKTDAGKTAVGSQIQATVTCYHATTVAAATSGTNGDSAQYTTTMDCDLN